MSLASHWFPSVDERFSPERIHRYRSEGIWGDETIGDFVDAAAAARPDALCVAADGRSLTFGQARDQSQRLAGGLAALGVGHGDRVAVQLPNGIEAVLAYYAIAQLGAVFVPRMMIYREHEVADAIDRTDAKVLLVPDVHRGHGHAAMGVDLLGACSSLQSVVVVGDAPPHPDVVGFDDLLNASPYEGARPNADDVHIVLFTSGTTAKPKGVVHTFNTYVSCAKALSRALEVGESDVCLMPSPVMHNTGLQSGVLLPLITKGGTVMQPIWTASEGMELIARHKVTYSVGATPFVTMMIDEYDPKRHDLSSLRLFGCGGAPVPAATVKDAERVLGCKLMTIYGQSESSIATHTRLSDGVERVASSDGAAAWGALVSIRDDNDQEVPPGVEGEICALAPSCMLGYWDDPDRTAEVFPSDWCHSGDLGRMDSEGYIRVTGRKKDLIIRGGMNISPTEVEELLLEHPDIAQVAVVGLPDRTLGERMCAVVVPQAGRDVTLESVVTFLRAKKIANQKLPERLEVRAALPMTATGKVEKFRLRDELSPTTA